MLISSVDLQEVVQRPRSAPPSCVKELGPFPDFCCTYTPLRVDPQHFKKYKLKVLLETETTGVILLDDKYILKLTLPFVNVREIVGIMNLARKVIPVPAVHDYGYSGNCSYVLMDYVNGYRLDSYILKCGRETISQAPPMLFRIDRIVRKLARVGISHNDLYPRNIIVDRNLEIIAVVDWDVAGPLTTSREYINRLHATHLEEYAHDWDHIFLKYCPDKLDLLSFHAEEYRPHYKRHVRQCPMPWNGFWHRNHWPGRLP